MPQPYVSMPLAEFFRDVYLPQKLRITSPSTIKHYNLSIRALARTIGRIPTLGDLTDGNIAATLRGLAAEGLSPHTVEQRRSYLAAIANWASQRQYLPWVLTIGEWPTPEIQPQAWTFGQLRSLWAACAKMPGDYHGVPASAWWKAFHAVLWDTGERTTAVLSAQWREVDLTTGTFRVPPINRKGKRRGAVYLLKPATVDLLTAILAPLRAAIFPLPGYKQCMGTFYHHYGRLLRIAGLPSTRRDKPQKMRRTFASFVERAGGDATKALGHSSRRVTVEHYLDETVAAPPAANLLLPSIATDAG